MRLSAAAVELVPTNRSEFGDSALDAPATSTPALTFVEPLKVLMPVKVMVPATLSHGAVAADGTGNDQAGIRCEDEGQRRIVDHRAAAQTARVAAVADLQRAAADGRGAGIGVGGKQRQKTAAHLGKRGGTGAVNDRRADRKADVGIDVDAARADRDRLQTADHDRPAGRRWP